MVMFRLLFTNRKSFQSISFSLGEAGSVKTEWYRRTKTQRDRIKQVKIKNNVKKIKQNDYSSGHTVCGYTLDHSLGSFLQSRGEASRNVSWSRVGKKTLSVYATQLGLHILTPRDKTKTETSTKSLKGASNTFSCDAVWPAEGCSTLTPC